MSSLVPRPHPPFNVSRPQATPTFQCLTLKGGCGLGTRLGCVRVTARTFVITFWVEEMCSKKRYFVLCQVNNIQLNFTMQQEVRASV